MNQEVSPEELVIKRGLAAEALLGAEAYAVAVNELYNQYMADITGSALGAKEKRECAFFQLRALQDITTELKSWVQAKDQLFSQPEE
jgi:hypothetical protein